MKSQEPINIEKVKSYFSSLPKATDLSIQKFEDELYNLNCMIFNYYDYLEFEPMNVDKELQKLDTVDITTAFAILTMVFREDHFINGAIKKRIKDGTLDRIIIRIQLLLNDN